MTRAQHREVERAQPPQPVQVAARSPDTNTLPSPSTASPVNPARPATNARWSSEWPGSAMASSGPKTSPSAAPSRAETTCTSPTRESRPRRPPHDRRDRASERSPRLPRARPPRPPPRRDAHREPARGRPPSARPPTCSCRTASAGSGCRRGRARCRGPRGRRRSTRDEPVDRAVERGHVHAAPGVLPNDDSASTSSRVSRTSRARPLLSRADSIRPRQKSPNT